MSDAPDIKHGAWNPALVEKLHKLAFSSGPTSPAALQPGLAALIDEHGPGVHAELLALLCNLRFPRNEATDHWTGIVAHAATMGNKLGETVSLPVAVVAYFVEVNQKLENPVLIELKLFEQTRASVYRDELTGLYNYRYFREFVDREIHRGERYNPPLSLAMIDIDDFKQYNDQHGHEAGNETLAAIAHLLTGSLRKVDVAARYGGEEFALILPSTTKEAAYRVCDRARATIESHAFAVSRNETASMTVSIGIATFPGDARVAGELIRRADSAMYVAKAQGKNCVRLYGQDRRSYRRIPASLRGKFCVLAAEYHALTTVNLSEGGLRFRVDRQIPIGMLVDIFLTLPDTEREASFSGRVVRLEAVGEEFEVCVKIMDISGHDHSLLAATITNLHGDDDASGTDSSDATGTHPVPS